MKGEFNPLVSIIVPNFNRAKLISETIDSVIAQSYVNWELVLVDDGSSDGSDKIITDYAQKDGRIKLFRRGRGPKGAPTCRNIGLEKSTGEFVIYLDSDDILAPFCLEQRVSFYSNNRDKDFLVFPSLLFDEEINDLQILWNVDSKEDDLLRFLRVDALWQTTGPIYRREALERLNGFNEALGFWQDFDLHLRALMAGLTYLKFFDVRPDMYHRRNFLDSISRTIPFIKDQVVLQKRIDFYLYVVDYAKRVKFNLGEEANRTIWSVLFFFTSSFLIKHRSPGLFLRESFKCKRALGIGWARYSLSWCYGLVLFASNRHTHLKKVTSLYEDVFRKFLPDYRIISNNTLAKKKLSI